MFILSDRRESNVKYFNDETIGKIRRGIYSAVYFNRTKEILLKENNLKRVTMQIFQKKSGRVRLTF